MGWSSRHVLACVLAGLGLASIVGCSPPAHPPASDAGGALDVPVDVAVDVSVDVSVDVPVDVPVDLPMDVPVDLPMDVPVDLPVDVPIDLPVDLPVDVPVDLPSDVALPPDAAVDAGTADAADAAPDAGAAGSCTSDEWCRVHADPGDLGLCEELYCNRATGECHVQRFAPQDCCMTDADCDDGNRHTIDRCPYPGARCNTCGGCICLCEYGPVLRFSFEDGTIEGFTIVDQNEADGVTWTVVTENGYDAHALYLGDPRCGWYFNGANVDDDCATPYDPVEDPQYATPVRVELLSPELSLEPDEPRALQFWLAGDGVAMPPTVRGSPPGGKGRAARGSGQWGIVQRGVDGSPARPS